MGMVQQRALPLFEEVQAELPLTAAMAATKKIRDAAIARIILGFDQRKLVVVGPCSADDEDAVVEYCTHLAACQERVADRLVLVPRLYTSKARTKSTGYLGMLQRPNPTAAPDLIAGIYAIRRLNLRVISETGLTGADELLSFAGHRFIADCLSYVAIGARSVENQEYRLKASTEDVPVGMKNPPSGDLSVMLNAVYAAQQPQTLFVNNWEVQSSGNPLAHAVLRGFTTPDGMAAPNYSLAFLQYLCTKYRNQGFSNCAFMVDCNHANSNKRFELQPTIVRAVLESCQRDAGVAHMFRGFMIESYLVAGAQKPGGGTYGQSITDPCLGWEETEALLLSIADAL